MANLQGLSQRDNPYQKLRDAPVWDSFLGEAANHFGQPLEIDSGRRGVQDPPQISTRPGRITASDTETSPVDALSGLGPRFPGDRHQQVRIVEGGGSPLVPLCEGTQIREHSDNDLALGRGREEFAADRDAGVFAPQFIGFIMGEEAPSVEDIDEAFLGTRRCVLHQEMPG